MSDGRKTGRQIRWRRIWAGSTTLQSFRMWDMSRRTSAHRGKRHREYQRRSDGGYIGIYNPPTKNQFTQKNFMWLFFSCELGQIRYRATVHLSQNLYSPKSNSWLRTPLANMCPPNLTVTVNTYPNLNPKP